MSPKTSFRSITVPGAFQHGKSLNAVRVAGSESPTSPSGWCTPIFTFGLGHMGLHACLHVSAYVSWRLWPPRLYDAMTGSTMQVTRLEA